MEENIMAPALGRIGEEGGSTTTNEGEEEEERWWVVERGKW
jgi:hypothetical protein